MGEDPCVCLNPRRSSRRQKMSREQKKGCFIKLSAGLCNQLFMIATAYAHAKRNGYTLRLSNTSRYWDTILHGCKKWIGDFDSTGRIWREPRFSHTPIPPDARGLVGYFQSSKYFADVSGEIRHLFVPPEYIVASTQENHADILTTDLRDRSVVVHIRRGDYIMGDNKTRHGILDERYYRRAIDAARSKIGADVPLLVFSDDLPWCRAQSWLEGATFVDEPIDYRALWLMSQYRHFILANSTFSWWAAWLSGDQNGKVWAPDRWFGPTGPPDWKDIYEPGWIRLSIT
jgi:hypothetical protein